MGETVNTTPFIRDTVYATFWFVMGQVLASVCGIRLSSPSASAKKYEQASVANNVEATANQPTPTDKPLASWEKRPKLDPKDFLFSHISNDKAWKRPGSINGVAEMVIEDCAKSMLLILDRTVQVTVDSCQDCTIFIGPSEGRYSGCEDFLICCPTMRLNR
jgi:hypothetical protein